MRDTRRSWRRRLATACLFAAPLLWAPAAFSQTMTTGDIVGSVTDATGAVVPKATVTAKFLDENTIQTQMSNDKGEYRFSLMKTGDYTIDATTTGLKSKTQKFNLLVGQEATVNLTLAVQGTSETVEVHAETSILQTENANLASGFNTAQVVQLPMNGGDITNVAFSVPGIIVGGGCGGNFCVNGIPGASALFTLNGADDNDPYNNINNSGASNNTLGSNEVAEAAVVLNAYSADYGRFAGAQVNYVTKSGTNQYHGNLFHNYNDKIFNANDFFNNQASLQEPRSDSHNFGGNFGGPIRKNRLFLFFNYESLQYALPKSGSVTIPSPQLQQYALAHIPSTATALYTDAFSLWNNAPGASGAVPTTNGSGPLQDGNKHLGCGTGTFWNSNTPAPGGGIFGVTVPCSYKWSVNTSEKNLESLITIKGDYNITDKEKLGVRYSHDWGLQATSPSFISPVFNSLSSQPEHQGQITLTSVIKPTLVNNFVGSSLYYSAIFGVADFSKTSALMPESFSVGDGGFTGVGAGFPTGRNVGQGQLVDDLTWIHGSHTIKGGVNFRYDKITDTSIAGSSYKGSYSFSDLTDFVTGQINSTSLGSSFTQSFPDIFAAHIREYSLGAFVQDEWKVRRNVTLTLGFRVERDGNPACVDNCFARMNTQFGTAGYVGGGSIPYNQTITTGLHTAYQNLESAIPEPRFGFAWSPFGQGKTVIRGGIGLFANLFAGSVASSVFKNAPSVFSPSVSFGQVGLPTVAGSSAFAAYAAYNAFTSGFAAGDNLTQLQAALGKVPFSAPSYYAPPNNFVAPKVTEWSLAVEHPLTQHNVLAVTYTGNHGYNQSLSNTWANAFLCETSACATLSGGVNKYYGTSFAGLPTVSPDPRFLTITQVLTQGYSNYDALSVQVRHAFSHGFQGQIGYTWSHALGLSSIYNPYDLAFGYGSQSFDRRHAIVSDLIWQEPKLPNKYLNAVAGGWNLGTKMYIFSGTPFASSDSKINAQINSAGGFSGTFLATVIDPNIAKSCTAVHGISDIPCFTTNQFETYNSTSGVATPIQTNFGQTGPNVFRGPGYFDIDNVVSKKFFIRERMNFELGAQFSNTLNHPNFSNPTAAITSGSLGTTSGDVSPPTSIYGSGQGALVTGRVIVVTAKFSF